MRSKEEIMGECMGKINERKGSSLSVSAVCQGSSSIEYYCFRLDSSIEGISGEVRFRKGTKVPDKLIIKISKPFIAIVPSAKSKET